VLAQVTDPRKPRGVRHGLVMVLTTAVCAVAAEARSFLAIAKCGCRPHRNRSGRSHRQEALPWSTREVPGVAWKRQS
jgi:hypothetical protein